MRSSGCLSGVTRTRQPPPCVDAGDLDRVQVLVAGAERAGAAAPRRRGPPAARRQVARPLGGDDHPASEDGIASELGHAVLRRARRGRACALLARRARRRQRRKILADGAARCGSGTPMLYGRGFPGFTDRPKWAPPTFSFCEEQQFDGSGRGDPARLGAGRAPRPGGGARAGRRAVPPRGRDGSILRLLHRPAPRAASRSTSWRACRASSATSSTRTTRSRAAITSSARRRA